MKMSVSSGYLDETASTPDSNYLWINPVAIFIARHGKFMLLIKGLYK
jgi:hypothetical protein